MPTLPDHAIVVRGGQNLAISFRRGSGVGLDDRGRLKGISVNAAAGLSIDELSAANAATGYPGIPHNQLGVTTVGAIRAMGGDVVASPSRTNAYHATLSGLTADEAATLFRPTVANPNRKT